MVTITPLQNDTTIQIDQELVKDSVVHKNVGQQIVVTTSDKMKIVLRDYEDALRAKRDWTTPLSIVITAAATLVAADFKSFIGLTSDTWKALYILVCILSIIWFIKGIFNIIKFRKTNLESIIERLANNSQTENVNQSKSPSGH